MWVVIIDVIYMLHIYQQSVEYILHYVFAIFRAGMCLQNG